MNIDERSKRALILLFIAVGGVLYFNFLWAPWEDTRAEIRIAQTKLDKLKNLENPRAQTAVGNKSLVDVVPAFKMPELEDKQRLEFERSFIAQLQKGGINVTTLPQFTARGRKVSTLNIRQLEMTCAGKGKFPKIMDFLSKLYDNELLVGLEEFKVVKAGNDMDVNLTVSTFVQ